MLAFAAARRYDVADGSHTLTLAVALAFTLALALALTMTLTLTRYDVVSLNELAISSQTQVQPRLPT